MSRSCGGLVTSHQHPPQSLSALEVHAVTNHPWLDFLSDHYSSIWLLCWLAILAYWARPLTESRCRCRCSNHHRHRARYEVVQNRSRTATPRHQAIGVPRYPGPSRPPSLDGPATTSPHRITSPTLTPQLNSPPHAHQHNPTPPAPPHHPHSQSPPPLPISTIQQAHLLHPRHFS